MNKLLKMHRQMSDMMKKLGSSKGGLGALFGGGGMPQPDPAMLEQLQKGGLGGCRADSAASPVDCRAAWAAASAACRSFRAAFRGLGGGPFSGRPRQEEMTVELETERLRLRQLRESDHEALVALLCRS